MWMIFGTPRMSSVTSDGRLSGQSPELQIRALPAVIVNSTCREPTSKVQFCAAVDTTSTSNCGT